MYFLTAFTALWLIMLTWRAVPAVRQVRAAPKLQGTVVHVSCDLTADGRMYTPSIQFVHLDGRTETVKTSARASYSKWKIGDKAVVLIAPDGKADLYWPELFYGVLCAMYLGGTAILFGQLHAAYTASLPQTEVSQVATPSPSFVAAHKIQQTAVPIVLDSTVQTPTKLSAVPQATASLEVPAQQDCTTRMIRLPGPYGDQRVRLCAATSHKLPSAGP